MMLRMIVVVLAAVAVMTEAWAQDAFVQQRGELAHRKRRIILNNDGCDVLYYPKNLDLTVENALSLRTSPLAGSQVDTIFYCPISSGFSYFTYNTKVGTVLEHNVLDGRNATRDLINLGTDALKMVVDFGKQKNIEVFCSMRMNDTHDAAHTPDKPYPLFPPLKSQHPEWLIGTLENKPRFAPWSGVDYTHPEIRDLAYRFLEEMCRSYDIDGIELDFLRHCSYFKSVAYGGTASDAERDMMTELVRRVRTMADAEGRKRGRPILIAVRVPDSVDYSRAVGLDIERWLQDGLVDLLIATCYYQLNPWEYLVSLGHKYNVPVYPSLSDSRVRGNTPPYTRGSRQTYRARAAEAWQAGADGIYLFNFFDPKAPMLKEIGDPKALATMDKTYFVTTRNYTPNMYLSEGVRFQNVPALTPDNPWRISADKPITVPIMLGEESANASVKLCLLTAGPTAPEAALNGTVLGAAARAGAWWQYAVPAATIKPGRNEVTIKVAAATPDSAAWDVIWEGEKKPAPPWSVDHLGKNLIAEASDGALLVADRGVENGDYIYFSYAWNSDPARETVAEVQAKVVSGLSSIIFSNGVTCDRLILNPGEVHWYSTRQSYAMNTTDDFHTYRIVLKGQDMALQVDGKMALEARGKFTVPSPAGRNALQFGAASSNEVGETLWKSVKLRTGASSVFDVVIAVGYPK